MNTMTEHDVKSITVIGRRWFDKKWGNTYFSAEGLVNGNVVVSIKFEYGYDDHYIECIARELEKHGYMPDRKHYDYGGCEALWQYCRDRNIAYTYHVADVSRKKDL